MPSVVAVPAICTAYTAHDPSPAEAVARTFCPRPSRRADDDVNGGYRLSMYTADEMRFMSRAVEIARQCRDEHPDRPSPCVGAVLVRDGEISAEAHRGQFGPGDHAEYCLLEKILPGQDLSGTTLYTTLEPCTSRNPPKVPCAMRIVERGIRDVVIGIYDPDPRVNRKGWAELRDAGVRLRDFPEDLRRQIASDNELFLAKYTRRTTMSGSDVCFDYTKNNGRFFVGEGDQVVETRWSGAGHDSIHALDHEHHVALARYAEFFEEVHDPGALDFSSYSCHARKGEIVVFRNGRGDYALVKIASVLAGPNYRDDRTALAFDFEVRSRDSVT